MLSFTSQRLVVALSVALTVSIVAFLLLHLSGDLATAIAGPEATAAQVAEVRHQFGLDRPMTLQYLDWLWRALHFDFGNSFYYRDSVTSLVAARLPVTLTLGAISLALSLVIAVPLGALAAVYSGTIVDRLALGFCVL
jgi:ABC-type dipeptide/oligopeptide/nickel transport system permease component